MAIGATIVQKQITHKHLILLIVLIVVNNIEDLESHQIILVVYVVALTMRSTNWFGKKIKINFVVNSKLVFTFA